MRVQFTCDECGSSVEVLASSSSSVIKCKVCQHESAVKFSSAHEEGILEDCPKCERKDFYKQADFNRKIGVILFVIAAILSIFTYGISFIVLYICDLILFKRLGKIGICYKCQTVFRDVSNIEGLHAFDHEMNDRIIYSDHDFDGKPLSH